MVAFAVNVDEVASPLVLVVATQSYDGGWPVQEAEANVPLAPLDGAAKVTETPDTGLPFVSVTSASNGLANAVLPAADWLEPDTIAIVVGVPATTVKVWVLELVALPLTVPLAPSVTGPARLPVIVSVATPATAWVRSGR